MSVGRKPRKQLSSQEFDPHHRRSAGVKARFDIAKALAGAMTATPWALPVCHSLAERSPLEKGPL
jgi:hypothetical protein